MAIAAASDSAVAAAVAVAQGTMSRIRGKGPAQGAAPVAAPVKRSVKLRSVAVETLLCACTQGQGVRLFWEWRMA